MKEKVLTIKFDLIIRGAEIVNHAGRAIADIGISDGKFKEFGDLSLAHAENVYDAHGLTAIPGVIDSQVHFREPGLEWKEDLESGSRAAVMGGVVAVFEMPNTQPNTTDEETFLDKMARANNRMHCDYAFYVGGTTENTPILPELERLSGCCGVKVFMGASTGSLLVADDEGVEKILKMTRRRVAFHSEDEYRLAERRSLAIEGDWNSHEIVRDATSAIQSTRRLLNLAKRHNAKIHVLHVSTADEMDILLDYKDIATVEVTPQHLTLNSSYYNKIHGFAQMNPPIRDQYHVDGLWRGLLNGVVDVIGSDHAPHTIEEKLKPYPKSPSGMPGVQTLLPIMLMHVAKGTLSLERLVDLTSAGPARIFQLVNKGRMAVGYDADITLIDLKAKYTILNEDQESKCKWTPFHEFDVQGQVKSTIIRGNIIMRDGELNLKGLGKPCKFLETL